MLQEQRTNPSEDFDFLAFMAQQPQQPGSPGGLLALPGLGEDEDDGTVALPPRAPWWRRRGPIIGLILLAILILGSIFGYMYLTRKRPVQLQTAQIMQGNVALTISATGPLQGGTYNINFSGTGKIAEIDVKVGQHVNQGQVVAKLDPTSLQD